jgi:hypothetical protein
MSTLRPAVPRNHDHALRNWVILTTVVLLVAFTLMVWGLTGSFVAALGVAGFAAMWGGVGFGVMAAGAAQALREERSARDARRTTREAA